MAFSFELALSSELLERQLGPGEVVGRLIAANLEVEEPVAPAGELRVALSGELERSRGYGELASERRGASGGSGLGELGRVTDRVARGLEVGERDTPRRCLSFSVAVGVGEASRVERSDDRGPNLSGDGRGRGHGHAFRGLPLLGLHAAAPR